MMHTVKCSPQALASFEGGGYRGGLPLLPMQHPKMAHTDFQSWVFVSKNAVNKILKLNWKYLWATLYRDADIGCPVVNTIRDSVQY